MSEFVNLPAAELTPIPGGGGGRSVPVGVKAGRTGKLLSYLAVAVVMGVYLYPLVFLLNTALKSDTEFFQNPTGVVGAPPRQLRDRVEPGQLRGLRW